MFSIFKKKTIIPHVRLAGVIGSAGKFKQGLDLVGQKNILKKAFCLKKIKCTARSCPFHRSFNIKAFHKSYPFFNDISYYICLFVI